VDEHYSCYDDLCSRRAEPSRGKRPVHDIYGVVFVHTLFKAVGHAHARTVRRCFTFFPSHPSPCFALLFFLRAFDLNN
jgi:hypothetical protein